MDVKLVLIYIIAWCEIGNVISSKPMISQFGTAYLNI